MAIVPNHSSQSHSAKFVQGAATKSGRKVRRPEAATRSENPIRKLVAARDARPFLPPDPRHTRLRSCYRFAGRVSLARIWRTE